MPHNVEPLVANVEISHEMVEAGVEQLAGFNREFEFLSDGVIRIYQAMELAKRGHRINPAEDTFRLIREDETAVH